MSSLVKSNLMYLLVQTATGPFAGQSSLAVRLSKDSSSPKHTPKEASLPKKHCLFKEKVLHTSKKCFSLSTLPSLQYLQSLRSSGTGGEAYLPTSTCRWCAEIRSLVSHCLLFLFLTVSMYGSLAKLPLKVL